MNFTLIHLNPPVPQRSRGSTARCVWLNLALALWTAAAGFEPAGARAAEPASAPGIVQPFLDVTLSAPVPGILAARKFKEGDAVKVGDAIVELDRKLEELETARRKLVRDQKKDDYEGTRRLFETTKGVSREDLEKKEVDYRVAEVEYEMAAEQLRRRQVVSPLAGVVTSLLLEVGESCQPYQPLVRVVDTQRCYFLTDIEVKHAARLKVDQTMKLEIETGTGVASVQGRIVFLSPVVDAASGLLKVKVLFDNADGRVQAGVAGRMILE